MKINNVANLFLIASALLPLTSYAQSAKSESQAQNGGQPETLAPFRVTVQVTATRFGEPIQEVPGAISVVTGEEIRARGATDLRTALALLGGVSLAHAACSQMAGDFVVCKLCSDLQRADCNSAFTNHSGI